MALIGYSGKPVWQKLGIRPETRIRLVSAPANYPNLIDCSFPLNVVKSGEADLTHYFACSKEDLKQTFTQLTKNTAEAGCIWISWYKKSAGISTDITEDRIRDIVLSNGWVDVKNCAVSEGLLWRVISGVV